ncbi:MAG TPA: T9SS type A sorting domain-containing protein [Arachidicoccus sp.]
MDQFLLKTQRYVTISVLLLLISFPSIAQRGTDASGGDGSGSAGSISYSIGQIDYVMATGSDNTIVDGIQQPYVNSDIPLPIIFGSFAANADGKVIKLNWITSSEINNKTFDIERSADGNTFYQIGYVNTKAVGGNSSKPLTYDYTDVSPVAATYNYYRLKQVDIDSRYDYSNIVSAYAGESASPVISPNPAADMLHVANMPIGSNFNIIGMSGQIMQSGVVSSNNMSLNVSALPVGLYILRIQESNGNTVSLKFIKR